jgi:O-methyltransferase
LNISETILNQINPPDSITSFDQINKLICDDNCLTLIEKSFFDSIKEIIREICREEIRGDLVFIGVFKGGGALYLASLFKEFGISRRVWLFDSFKGFNRLTIENQKDVKSLANLVQDIVFENQSNVKSVRRLFESYNLDSNLQIVEGYLEDTFKSIEIERIAFLHIDVDFYEPTYLSLEHLYPLVTRNGWVVIDDYNVPVFECKKATDKYINDANIEANIVKIGNYPIGWRKT